MSKYADIPWHTMSIEEVEQALKTDQYRGLGGKTARKRRERVGENKLFVAAPTSFTQCIKMLFCDAAMLLLLLLCLVGCCFSLWYAVIGTLCILTLYGTLMAVAYVKTQRLKENMSEYGAPEVVLIRSGRRMSAQARMLVPGDLICLQRGDVLPADVRLVSCVGHFTVRTLREYRDGVAVFDAATEKDARAILTAQDTSVLTRQNMAYAGSVVTDGCATALVVTTGEDTYHGALFGIHALAAQVGELPSLPQIRKYVNRYSLVLCALLLPVTAIGFFSGEGKSLFELFLVALSLVVASMSEQMLALAQIVVACGVVRTASTGKGGAAAIIKNYAAIEHIAGITDVFFAGIEALSDGDLHPAAAIVEGEVYRKERLNSLAVRRFFPYLYWYDQCRAAAAVTIGAANEEAADGLTALLRGARSLATQISVDTEQLNIRVASMMLAPDGSGDVLLTLREPDGSLLKRRLLCTIQGSLLDRCIGSAAGNDVQPWQAADRSRIRTAVASLQAQGCRWLFCATLREEGCVLEGAIALRQAPLEQLPAALESLSHHGVRTTLLAKTLALTDVSLLQQCGWISHPDEIVSGAGCSPAALAQLYDERLPRVITGVDAETLSFLLHERRSEGGVCAVVSLRDTDVSLKEAADVVVSYDATPFHMKRVGESKPIPMTEQERMHALQSNGDDSLRRSADLLLRRSCRDGGAFSGMLGAIRAARAIHNNLGLMLQYLQVTQFLRMTFLLVPLLFGSVMLSSPLVLLSGLWVDLGFAVLLALRRGGEDELLSRGQALLRSDRPVRARWDRVAASVLTGSLVLLLSVLLKAIGVLANEGEQVAFLFLCLLVVQITAFLLFYQNGTRGIRLPVLGIVLLVTLLPLALLCISPVVRYLGCGSCRLPLLLISLAAAGIFLLCSLACAALRGRLKEWLRKILTSLAS